MEDNFTWNNETLFGQLMLLADSGLYFHLSRLANSPAEYQFLQVLFILDRPSRNDYTVYLEDWQDIPKQLGLPNLDSYTNVTEFVNMLREPSHSPVTFRLFFEAFQLDPARSGRFHHDPATWHAFAATRSLATVSSR